MKSVFLLLALLPACSVSPRPELAVWRLVGKGTGFAIESRNGTARLLTADHVVEDGVPDAVQGERRLSGGRIVVRDEEADVALLEYPSAEPVEVLELGPAPDLGDVLVLIGYPNEVFWITEGRASGRGRVSAPSFGGSSGSPVIDESGRAVGIMNQYELSRVPWSPYPTGLREHTRYVPIDVAVALIERRS